MGTKETAAIGGALAGAQAGSAVAPGIGTAIGAALGGLGGFLGTSSGGETEAQRQQRRILEQLQALRIPTVDEQQLTPQYYTYGGDVQTQTETPEQLAARDALQNVSLDPKLRQSQMQALETLTKLGQSSFTPEEQAQMNAMRRQAEADNTSRMKALLQQQQQRGVGTSDAALVMRAQEAQNAANEEASQSDRLAAMAQQRALAAISGAGTLAGNINAQDYSQQAALANALNQREMTNMAQRANVQNRNVSALNQFNMANAANRQKIANSNVDLDNTAQQHNKGLWQQQFNNQISKIIGQQAPAKNLGNLAIAGQEAQNQATSNIISGAVKAVPEIYKSMQNKPKYDPQTGELL